MKDLGNMLLFLQLYLDYTWKLFCVSFFCEGYFEDNSWHFERYLCKDSEPQKNSVFGLRATISHNLCTIFPFKGVLHPRPILWLYNAYFSKITTHWWQVRYDMFLVGNISRNLTTALEFHLLKWLFICDVIKQNEMELANTVFKIQLNKVTKQLISSEPIAQLPWGLHQIKA